MVGDRAWAVVDAISGRLASAKRHSRRLHASVDEDDAVLPGGRRIRTADDPESDRALSEWLDGAFRFDAVAPTTPASYEMTFESTDDDAEVFEIPAPVGTFLDVAPVHIVTSGTLTACASARPDHVWDVRRFRPNLVIDTGGSEPLSEQAWGGMHIRVGSCSLRPRSAEAVVWVHAAVGRMPRPSLPGVLRSAGAPPGTTRSRGSHRASGRARRRTRWRAARRPGGPSTRGSLR